MIGRGPRRPVSDRLPLGSHHAARIPSALPRRSPLAPRFFFAAIGNTPEGSSSEDPGAMRCPFLGRSRSHYLVVSSTLSYGTSERYM